MVFTYSGLLLLYLKTGSDNLTKKKVHKGLIRESRFSEFRHIREFKLFVIWLNK